MFEIDIDHNVLLCDTENIQRKETVDATMSSECEQSLPLCSLIESLSTTFTEKLQSDVQKWNDIPIKQTFINHLSSAEASELKVNGKIDYRRRDGRYVIATITEKKGTKLKIHYHDAYKNETDDWCDYSTELYRFVHAGSISKRPAHRFKELAMGDYIDINPIHAWRANSCVNSGWRAGEIIEKDDIYQPGQIRVCEIFLLVTSFHFYTNNH